MNNQKIVSKLFLELSKEIDSLSNKDFEKFQSGNFKVNIVFNEKKQIINHSNDSERFTIVLKKLQSCTTREDGLNILVNEVKTRKELESLAKKSDIHIMKSDKVDKIREKIIEGIIGAFLRSSSIQKNDS
ncbi:hypothetical protein [Providencia rettgeri]|uniref:hypothetical protein n=1 Tax=Providencia rettgeri TaxID=587 RepID=UPI0018C673AD|nr:hypothetical protein [Providencia rettgeri]MBG5932826.1 hypothetical protein [Providencia rettgeri]